MVNFWKALVFSKVKTGTVVFPIDGATDRTRSEGDCRCFECGGLSYKIVGSVTAKEFIAGTCKETLWFV